MATPRATQAPSRVTAASLELSSLSQASYKAAEQLTSILNAAEVCAPFIPYTMY